MRYMHISLASCGAIKTLVVCIFVGASVLAGSAAGRAAAAAARSFVSAEKCGRGKGVAFVAGRALVRRVC